MLSANEIRTKFLTFFESKNHKIVPSSSLVPNNDPTLMFTNAGMVQFKNVFTGVETRDYARAVSSQRCVRAGGKHNDLENVGHTARHHTFFEMLGNFSFGDYFKEEAITWAWEFLTGKEWLNISAEKLYVTVYHTDDEAFNIWHKTVGIEKDRIIRIATDDNFWSMGDDGPCGPCTEIFYDHGPEIAGGLPGTPEEDGDRYIEIWNLVFMQNVKEGGKIIGELPAKSIDTGMGIERIAAAVQGVHNNYDIDLFQTIIQKCSELTGVKYGAETSSTASLRVVADHLRAMCFLMVDGVMPSNEGRGYVLRRIMRRAMRHMYLMGVNEPMIYKLVSTLSKEMGDAYPELSRAQKMIEDVIKLEEERFIKTLGKGLEISEECNFKLLKSYTNRFLVTNEGINSQSISETRSFQASDEYIYFLKDYSVDLPLFPGETAFMLYDTFGFPLDLTEDVLKEKGMAVDVEGFNKLMAGQRAKARAAHKGSGDSKLSDAWFKVRENNDATEFLGYEKTRAEGVLKALVANDKSVMSIKKGEKAQAVFTQTPFYAESGGQIGDTGTVELENGAVLEVTDCQKIMNGELFVHEVICTKGEAVVNEAATLKVNEKRRSNIKNNHSATHLLNAVLREVLGEHVFQKGSVVTDEKLRFDFSHPKALTAEEIVTIESKVNDMILANEKVTAKIMDKEAAIASGAMAMFGEKYGDEVRVLSMGDNSDKMLSVELCGGTHVSRTGDIGLFTIITDSSISAGVRRIEAASGRAALEILKNAENNIKSIAASIKTSPNELAERVEAMQAEIKKLKQEVKDAKKGGGAGGASAASLADKAEEVNGIKFVGAALENIEAETLREMVDEIKVKLGSGVILLACNNGDKSSIVAGVTKDLVGKYKAGDIVNAAASAVGGKGGGRPDMAMAGGKAGDMALAVSNARGVVA